MTQTRVQLCGRLAATVDGRRVEARLPGRQGRLLFAFLLLNRRRPVTRDELAALVAGERPAPAGDVLSPLLSKLRRALGPERLAGRGEVRLTLGDEAWVDAEAAVEALHRAEAAVARAAWTDAWGPARAAQHIAARTFLAGEDGAWVAAERRRLEDVHVRALELAAESSLRIGGSELATAERAARALVELAPFRELGHRVLMEALAARGSPAEALRVYEALRVRLREELGTAPAPQTQELHRRLLG